jgi:hypothetical protein
VGQHHRHLQEDTEEIADVVGTVFGEALGAVAALQQEGPALGDFGQLVLEFAGLAGEHQRRELAQLRLGRLQLGRIRIDRHLRNRLLSPALWRPSRRHRRDLPVGGRNSRGLGRCEAGGSYCFWPLR